MRIKKALVTGIASVTLSLPLISQAATVTLDEVLRQAGDGAGHAAANAELEAYYAARDQREDEAGLQVFGSASVGRYRELVTDDLRDNYYGRNYAIGLRYPLLGTLRRQAQAVQSAERDARRSQIDAALRRSQQRLALRSAYADWWRAQQENELCADVEQASRRAESDIQERLHGKWIRPSDAKLMQSEWTAVRQRCSLQQSLLDDTRTTLASLGADVQPSDQAIAPALANQPARLQDWQNALQNHPRMEQRRADIALAEQGRERPWYTAIESNVTLATTREERSGASKAGDGLEAGISVSAPFDLLGYSAAQKREGEARYQAATRSLEAEQGQLLRDLGSVLERQRRSLNEYEWRSERRLAVDTILAEESQRGSLNSGDAILRLLQAQVDHYNASFAMISAWHGAWLDESALRLFGDDSEAFSRLLGPSSLVWEGEATSSGPSGEWREGVYIWDSAELLDANQQDAQLLALQNAGMGVLNVGLDATQVASDDTQDALAELLRKAHAWGFKVNLLLGEPDWMRPQSRHRLVQLIQRYQDLPFDGLHLDLEVEQLGWPVSDHRLRDWLATLRDAKAASPWPLGISSHPRWFDEMAARTPCVPCELEPLQLDHISLMIYNRNPTNSANRALAISKRWPELHFRLAQSTEPDIGAELSWADATPEQLRLQTSQWQTLFTAVRLGGIDWQSWTYYPRSR